MHYCVIGNSHVAALKLGWDRVSAEYPNVRITFFAAPATEMESLEVCGTTLKPGTPSLERYLVLSGKAGQIDTESYDGIALHGMGFSNRFTRSIYNRYRLLEHVPRRNGFLISRDGFSEALHGLLISSMGWRVAEKVREALGRPPIMLCQPHPGQRIVETDKRWEIHPEDRESLADLFLQTIEGIRTRGTPVLTQPPETVFGHIFTKTKYVGSPGAFSTAFGRVSGETDAPGTAAVETTHMNAEFGAAFIRQFLGQAQALVSA